MNAPTATTDNSPAQQPTLEQLTARRDALKAEYQPLAKDDPKRAELITEWRAVHAQVITIRREMGLTSVDARGAKQEKQVEAEYSRWRRRIQWVYDSLGSDKPRRTKSAGDRAFWQWARENKGEFFAKYVPLLVKTEKPEDEDREDEAVKGNLALIDEWFKAREGTCPHCGRSGPRTTLTQI